MFIKYICLFLLSTLKPTNMETNKELSYKICFYSIIAMILLIFITLITK